MGCAGGWISVTPSERRATQPVCQGCRVADRALTSELVLQARLSDGWANLWRMCSHVPLDADYETANWFTATYPNSLFVTNMIAARPGAGGVRHTFLNGRLTLRRPDGTAERQELDDEAGVADALAGTFGLALPMEDIRAALATLARLNRRRAAHPFFKW